MKTSSLVVAFSILSALALGAAEVPAKAELKTMTEESLTSFGEAVKEKDFSSFYEDIASIWQKQTSAEKLQETFKDFLNKEIDIPSIVAEMEPVFDQKAEINLDDVLVVKGYYPTAPHKVKFQLKYLKDENDWKLVGIKVDLEE